MGFAQIVSGGTDGRYTVLLDWGQSTKDAVLAALSVHQTSINVQIGQAEAKVEAGRAAIAALNERIEAEIAAIIARQNTLPPGMPEGHDDRELRPLLEQVREQQMRNAPLALNLSRLKFERTKVAKQIAYWNAFDAQETRQVWCVDRTEDKAAGTYAATLDIPGDPSLLVLAPGARTPTDADGQLVAREMMAPHQAFFNAAILPGWSKHLPTARWGTITGLNFDGDTADIALADAYLSGQRLNVNQTSTLTGVPVVYMTCNARAFEIGDRVVVQFVGQDWSAPRVVGFVDNPRGCHQLAVLQQTTGGGPDASKPWYTPPSWADQLFYDDDIWEREDVPAVTAHATEGIVLWLGWGITGVGPGGADLSYSLDLELPAFEWIYSDNPYTTWTNIANYFVPPGLSCQVTQTLLSRNVIGVEPDWTVSGNWRVRVQIGMGASPSSYLFDYTFDETGGAIPVPEFTDPEDVDPPNIIFDPTDRYPTLSYPFTGTLSPWGIPYSYTVHWGPYTASAWQPTSIA